ncbi:transposase [Microtetraspora sp. NBRC 16547]|uniref:transposase n=1 Tax=Microtetraspora sp. NBRC 16547 TaxID=3030993 RepID=UPI00331A82B1
MRWWKRCTRRSPLSGCGKEWQDKYKLRAGVEGSMRQAVAATGVRRARYRGLAKVHLEHVLSAVALNLGADQV